MISRVSDHDVIVVGAGVAGLAAADALLEAGLGVAVVEATARIGGRIFTQHDFAGATIERGAEFVHGRHPGLIAEIEKAGLTLVERPFEPLGLKDGRDVTSRPAWNRVFQELSNPEAADVPIAERIAELLAAGEWTEAEARRLRNYVQGYNAADPARASARALSIEARASEEIGEDGNASIREGYDALVERLARRARDARSLHLGSAVRAIEWREGSVLVELGGETPAMRASAAVVTLPLGILRLDDDDPDAVRFSPPLAQKVAAARKLAMGNVVKIFLRLDAPLSRLPGIEESLRVKLERASFLQTADEPVPTWWIAGERDAPVVVGWCGGPVADALSARSEEGIVRTAIETLARALGIPPDLLAASVRAQAAHDWRRERRVRGAYSWIPVGGLEAAAELAAPIAGTLFFAGEAADTRGYRGTVHGAYETGRRAVTQLLEARAPARRAGW